jgi:hypothetical protein
MSACSDAMEMDVNPGLVVKKESESEVLDV